MSKGCQKNGADRFAPQRAATKLKFVKQIVYGKAIMKSAIKPGMPVRGNSLNLIEGLYKRNLC